MLKKIISNKIKHIGINFGNGGTDLTAFLQTITDETRLFDKIPGKQDLGPSLPLYKRFITNPISLREINNKIAENGTKQHYRLIGDFLKDIEIMFSNCYNFNQESDSSYYSTLALRLYNNIIVEVEKKYSETKKRKSKIVSSSISVYISSDDEHKSKKIKRDANLKLQKELEKRQMVLMKKHKAFEKKQKEKNVKLQQELEKKQQELEKKQQEYEKLKELNSKVEKEIGKIKERMKDSEKKFKKKKFEQRDLISLTEIYGAANTADKIQLPGQCQICGKNALGDDFSGWAITGGCGHVGMCASCSEDSRYNIRCPFQSCKMRQSMGEYRPMISPGHLPGFRYMNEGKFGPGFYPGRIVFPINIQVCGTSNKSDQEKEIIDLTL